MSRQSQWTWNISIKIVAEAESFHGLEDFTHTYGLKQYNPV